MKIIDAHMHCGIQNVDQPLGMIRGYLAQAGIDGACLYAPVEDIYDRYDYHFRDSTLWVACRQRANRYLLDIQQKETDIFAYYFVWNDFRKEELAKGYRGVKWHRHDSEPEYNYNDPRCEAFLQEVYRHRLPIVLEESYGNTLSLIKRIDGRTPVIIPHLGGLNGGFYALFHSGVWDGENVYADTALASRREMAVFLERYGSDRLIFGSDFPFGIPYSELQKVRELQLAADDFAMVVGGNILALIDRQVIC
ncbi:MAG TPA: amidohydrolase family protein [Syntrophales bacterium]|nr:amidohydrolase family protein [Syntrophales bacterium]HON23783.1 amidohydrolase family protein [Syntrophales bacterium]HOU77864.1 amidohydrolase family protein [Syntrophales bacterium]HPC31755.1 amidohydrolase family protein [Syntrophales bacterium]HQG34462.1 amidohydrolase family protein [Syntrophales bacterium]